MDGGAPDSASAHPRYGTIGSAVNVDAIAICSLDVVTSHEFASRSHFDRTSESDTAHPPLAGSFVGLKGRLPHASAGLFWRSQLCSFAQSHLTSVQSQTLPQLSQQASYWLRCPKLPYLRANFHRSAPPHLRTTRMQTDW